MENAAGPADVRVPAGADLRQPDAGRPDQPRHAQDAVGPVAGDGGRGDHVAPRDLPAAAAVLRHGHAEPAGDGRHVPACPSRRSTASSSSCCCRRPTAGRSSRSWSGPPKAAAEVRVVVDGQRLLEMRRIARIVSRRPESAPLAACWTTATHPDHSAGRRAGQAAGALRGRAPAAAQAMVLAAKIRAAADARAEVARDDLLAGRLSGVAPSLDLEFPGPGRERAGRSTAGRRGGGRGPR